MNWWLLPVSVVIAAVANGAGIGGATFFSPLFLLVLGLEPTVAIGAALTTEVFGFASGVVAHARAGTIDWKVVGRLVAVSVPAAIAGSLLAGRVPRSALELLLGVGLLAIAVTFIRHHDPEVEDEAIARGVGVVSPVVHRSLVSSDGIYEYDLCRVGEGRIGAGVGGLLVGLISTGLGEANSYTLVRRCRIPGRVAVAVSVTTVAVTALAASMTHLVAFLGDPAADPRRVLAIVAFTVPGVLLGGQLGPTVVRNLPERTLVRALGWVFAAVAVVTFVEALTR